MFLSVAHDRNELTPQQAWEIYEERNWCHDHGIPRTCRQIAMELGYLDDTTAEQIWIATDALSKEHKPINDVLRRPTRLVMPRQMARVALAFVVGCLWFFATVFLDTSGVLSGIVFWVVWTCAEAFLDADEPSAMLAGKRMGWSTVLRVTITLSWVLTLAYAIFCAISIGTLGLTNPAPEVADRLATLIARFWTSSLAFVCYSFTILLTAFWRRRRLRTMESRTCLLRTLLTRIDLFRRGRLNGGTTPEQAQQYIDEILISVGAIVEQNHWIRLLGTVLPKLRHGMAWIPGIGRPFRRIPRTREALESVTVALLVPDSSGRHFNIQSVTTKNPPTSVQLALEQVRTRHHPVTLDVEWFRMNKQNRSITDFRKLADRTAHVSLAGATFFDRKLLAVEDVEQCRTFDEQLVRKLDTSLQVDADVREWLNFSSVISVPVPPNCSRSEDQKGVLMIHRNVTQQPVRDDLAAAVAAARALGAAL